MFAHLSLETWLDFGRKGVGMRGHLSWAHIHHFLLSWDMMDLKGDLNPVTRAVGA